jgi:hypothetical protein
MSTDKSAYVDLTDEGSKARPTTAFMRRPTMTTTSALEECLPKFKILKRVAHNISDSFTSPMNFSVDDYSMGHILRFAREAGIGTPTIDLLTVRDSRQIC